MTGRFLGWLRENWLTMVVVCVLAVGYFSLRMSPTEMASAEEFVAGLAQGVPSVVVFYSNT
jgi:hypothetical protein